MANLVENYDVVIVGAGHAGCEAALASARLGLNTIVFTVSVDSIALMPCNPNIGGTSKGHLVRELDALGGEMGKNIDKTFIQSKMLNKSKGPAVHSLRAQADKQDYTREMRKTLENTENLTIRQAEVAKLLVEDGVIKGVETVLHKHPAAQKNGTLRVSGSGALAAGRLPCAVVAGRCLESRGGPVGRGGSLVAACAVPGVLSGGFRGREECRSDRVFPGIGSIPGIYPP